MTSIIKATYNYHDVRTLVPGYTPPPDSIMGEAFWGNIPTDTPVNISHAVADAQRRFLEHRRNNSDFNFLPLADPMPPEVLAKAIFGLGCTPYQSPELYQAQCEPILKAWLAPLAEEYPEIKKAMTTGTSLMHVVADEAITSLYKRPYPIQALIPVESNKGKAAHWDVIPPFGHNSASFGTEDPSLIETEIKPFNRLEYVKYMYAVGRITQGAKFSGLTQYPARDLKTIQIDSSQEALRALRERSVLGVTRDVSDIENLTFEPANDLQYAGMYELITKNQTTPNWIDGEGFDTYHEIMDGMRSSYKLMVQDGMRPNLGICDYTTFFTIAAGLQEYFRTQPIKEFVQGISKVSLVFPGNGGLPLVPTEFLPMDPGAGSIFLIDTRLWARRVLWQDMYQDLANINTSDKFVISACEVLIDKSDKDGMSSLHGGVFNLN